MYYILEQISTKHRPHEGRPFWAVAKNTSHALAALEMQLKNEYESSHGSVLPAPAAQMGQIAKDKLLSDLKNAKGSTLITQSMSSGWGGDGRNQNITDWTAKRFGANPPPATVQLRENLVDSMLAASGCPPGLVRKSR